MNFLRKKQKTKCCFIKTVELTKEGWITKYHTEVDGIYISNSTSQEKEKAEMFFEKVLQNKGMTKLKEVIREQLV